MAQINDHKKKIREIKIFVPNIFNLVSTSVCINPKQVALESVSNTPNQNVYQIIYIGEVGNEKRKGKQGELPGCA